MQEFWSSVVLSALGLGKIDSPLFVLYSDGDLIKEMMLTPVDILFSCYYVGVIYANYAYAKKLDPI